MTLQTQISSSFERLDIQAPPPASPSQFGALPENTHTAAGRTNTHTPHTAYPSMHPIDRFTSSPAAHTPGPVLPIGQDQVHTVDSFKDEVKLRLAWLDDEIRLLELRERWYNTRFSDRSRRNRERKKLDKLEQELRAKWEHIFFVTRYKEMSARYSKTGLMGDFERHENAHEMLQEARGGSRPRSSHAD